MIGLPKIKTADSAVAGNGASVALYRFFGAGPGDEAYTHYNSLIT